MTMFNSAEHFCIPLSHLTVPYSSQISLVMGTLGNEQFSPKKMDKDMKAEEQTANRKRIVPGVRRGRIRDLLNGWNSF